jgi:hypothetical protein
VNWIFQNIFRIIISIFLLQMMKRQDRQCMYNVTSRRVTQVLPGMVLLLWPGNHHFHDTIPEINNTMHEMLMQFLIVCSTLYFDLLNGVGLDLALCGRLSSILNSYSNCVHFCGRFVKCWYLVSTLYKSFCWWVDNRLFSQTLARSCSEIFPTSVPSLLSLYSWGEVT